MAETPDIRIVVPPQKASDTQSGTFRYDDLSANANGLLIGRRSETETGTPLPISTSDNQWNLGDIRKIRKIGESNGIVWLVEHKNKGQLFALKVIKWNLDETAVKWLTQELKINHSLQCPYVVKYCESFYANGEFSILLEYMDCGTLGDLQKKAKKIPEKYLAAICKQVLEGLSYLNHHEKHIIHRDLKPSNLLINQKGEAKICDFGVSATVAKTYGQASTYIGTSYYVAPERIKEDRYDHKSDIWSLGLVFLECATGQFPYDIADYYPFLEAVVKEEPPSAPSDQFSPEFCSFISSCLQKKPADRKSARQLLEDPFLHKCESQQVDLSAFFKSVLHLQPSETLEATEKPIPEGPTPVELESKEVVPAPKRKSNSFGNQPGLESEKTTASMPNPQLEQATPSPSSIKIKYMDSEVGVSSKSKAKEVTNELEKVDSLLPNKSLPVVQSESVQSIGAHNVLVDPFPMSILPVNSAPLVLRTEDTAVQATDSSVSQSNSSLAADPSKIEDDEAFFQQILLSLSQPGPGIPTAPFSSVLATSSEMPVGTQVLNALNTIREILEQGDDVFTVPQLFGRFVDSLETVVRYDGGGQINVHSLKIVKRIARDIQSLKTDFNAPSAFGISLDRKKKQKDDLDVQFNSNIQAGLAKTIERKAVSAQVIELEARLAEMTAKEMELKAKVNILKDEVKAQQENLRSLASSISADEKEQERLLAKKEFARQALHGFGSSIFPSAEAPP